MRPDYTCVRCGEDVRCSNFYRLKGGKHEHSDCRARWEGTVVASALIAWAEAIRSRCYCRDGATWMDLCEGCRGR